LQASALKKKRFEKEALIHLEIIFRAALGMTGSEMEAEDLAQETFLRAYKFFEKFEDGTNCKAWLFKIMTNLFINKYNRRKSRPVTVCFDDVEDFYLNPQIDSIDYLSNIDCGSDWIFENLLDDDIRRLLQELPEDFRITVVLCDIQGFSYEETARITDSKIGTVKSRLFRARGKLRKGLYAWARKNGYLSRGILHGAA